MHVIVDLSLFTTGVCDRLRQLTFCAAYAALSGSRKLLIYERQSPESPTKLIQLFRLSDFDLFELSCSTGPTLKMTPFNSFPCIANAAQHLQFLKSNTSPSSFLQQWLTAYTWIIPSEKLLSLYPDLNTTRTYHTAIHIRSTDRISRLPSDLTITPRQLHTFCSQYVPSLVSKCRPTDPIYLASDSQYYYRQTLAALTPYSIFSSPSNWLPSGKRETSGFIFAYDLFNLARASNLYSTTGGGVPFTAHLIGGQTNSTYSIWTHGLFINTIFRLLRALKVFISGVYSATTNLIPR